MATHNKPTHGIIYAATKMCLFLCWFEALLRADISTRFWDIGLLFCLLFAVAAGFVFAGLFHLLPARAAHNCETILLVCAFFLFAAQDIYYAVFKTYFTVFSAGRGLQVLQFIDVILTTVMQKGSFLLLLAAPFCADALYGAHQKRAQKKAAWKACLLSILAGAAVYGITLLLLVFAGRGGNTPYTLYFEKRVLNESVQKLGLLTTMRQDLGDLWFGAPENDTADTSAVSIIGSPSSADDSRATESAPTEANSASTEADSVWQNASDGSGDAGTSAAPFVRKAQVLDSVDFAALAQTQTGIAADISRYIAAQTPTYTNEMTGLFAGKNLIYIVAESFSHYVIDKDRTPTLYKMQQEGFNFTNFYTGIWGVSTLDGEYVALSGLVPQPNTWSLLKSRNGSMPFTLASFLKRQGYTTYAYHDGMVDYYSRNLSHPNLGYDSWRGVGSGLGLTNQWPRSDLELVDHTTENYIHDEQFHVYYLTISGHLPYNFTGGDDMAVKNAASVADLPYSNHVKAYLAANVELDKAMELLLQRLEEAGRLEDTVIVLSGDHYPYGLTNNEISELAGHTVDPTFELYRNTLLIYNAGMTPQTVSKAASSVDIMPTVCNLFGLDYDSRIFSGRDIFSDSDPLVFFVSRSFITDKVMYDAEANTATPIGDATVTAEYIQEIAQEVSDKFRYARKILDSRYYNTLPAEAFTSTPFTREDVSAASSNAAPTSAVAPAPNGSADNRASDSTSTSAA